jgi:hypothetical protein
MQREIQAELLDNLPPFDPGAIGSRRDLRWLNFCMGHVGLVTRALRNGFGHKTARRILDLGGGDGHFLLRVCRALPRNWEGIEAFVVDRHNTIAPELMAGFASKGWVVHFAEADVFDYFRRRAAPPLDVIIANLVLHHFAENQIRELFALLRESTSLFLAVEPRRSPVALLFSKAVGVIGCNAVTRHDAPASVQAGFFEKELSLLWGNMEGWLLDERPAGLFSHLFVASRIQG